MPFNPNDIIAPDGPIARRLGGRYEERPQQAQMIKAVQNALANGGKLVAEAGTGVGKSFAYLLPVIEWIVNGRDRVKFSEDTSGRGFKGRVIVSTQRVAIT